MEIAYLHLVTNHIPIIGVPLAIVVLLLGIWRKSDELKAASFLILAGLGVLTIGVYLLGRGGEDFVEDLAGVQHNAIDDHEDFALFALLSVLAVAAVSVFALIRYRLFGGRSDAPATVFPRVIVILILLMAVGSAAALGYTGRLGGKIRHPEFHGAQTGGDPNEEESNGVEGEEGGKRRGRNRGER